MDKRTNDRDAGTCPMGCGSVGATSARHIYGTAATVSGLRAVRHVAAGCRAAGCPVAAAHAWLGIRRFCVTASLCHSALHTCGTFRTSTAGKHALNSAGDMEVNVPSKIRLRHLAVKRLFRGDHGTQKDTEGIHR